MVIFMKNTSFSNRGMFLENILNEITSNEYANKDLVSYLNEKKQDLTKSTEKKNSEKEKNRVEDLNVKYGQERANLKAKLSDAMMQEVKYQNHLSEITNRRYACEITLNANKPGSKLYIDMTERIAKLDEEFIWKLFVNPG